MIKRFSADQKLVEVDSTKALFEETTQNLTNILAQLNSLQKQLEQPAISRIDNSNEKSKEVLNG